MLRGRSFTLLILLAVLAATPAFSTPITWFTDPALWQVAVSGLTTIDFNTVNSVTLNPGDMIESHSTDPGFTFGNVAFTDMINLSVQNTKIGYPSVDSFPFDFGTHAYLQGMGSDGTTFPYLRVKLKYRPGWALEMVDATLAHYRALGLPARAIETTSLSPAEF